MTERKAPVLTSDVSRPHVWIRFFVPVLILALGVAAMTLLIKSKKKPTQRPRGERAAVVELMVLQKSVERVVINTSGTVVPGRAIALQARIAGEIIRTDPRFIPGGRFDEGEVILEIDPLDYVLAVTNSRAALIKAEYDSRKELGMQEIAKHEWKQAQAMNTGGTFSELDRELALREPDLRLAQGNLASARARLALAELNLQRTRIRAPFNCVVRSRGVDKGSQITAQTELAELAGTDAYWVNVALPTGLLRWIRSADQPNGEASQVTLRGISGVDTETHWQGRVLRKLVDLEAAGKQAQILVEVPRPDRPVGGKGMLLLGTYVRLAIMGTEVADVFAIPGRALKEGWAVWIMNGESRLDVRNVEVIWRDDERVLVRGDIVPGEYLVVSDLGTPIKGMLLQTLKDAQRKASGEAGAGPGSGQHNGGPGR